MQGQEEQHRGAMEELQRHFQTVARPWQRPPTLSPRVVQMEGGGFLQDCKIE